jgi:hypothetical protein
MQNPTNNDLDLIEHKWNVIDSVANEIVMI